MAKKISAKKDKTELIQQKAYELWENDGRKDNCELDYWLKAEAAVSVKKKKKSSVVKTK